MGPYPIHSRSNNFKLSVSLELSELFCADIFLDQKKSLECPQKFPCVSIGFSCDLEKYMAKDPNTGSKHLNLSGAITKYGSKARL